MRCALIEYNECSHGEILPSLVYSLNALGIYVDVYISTKLIHDNPFIYCRGLSYRKINTDNIFPKFWKARQRFCDYDFVILNSIEPKRILREADRISRPLIALMHNGNLITSDPEYEHFFASSHRMPLLLAKHISDFLSQAYVFPWIAPVYLGEIKMGRRVQGEMTRFCVQGAITFDRRNYDSLLEAIEQLRAGNIENFRVVVLGRDNPPHGKQLKEKIIAKNLGGFFDFIQEDISYQKYYQIVAGTHFILPLIDTADSRYKAYFQDKISSSLSVAIGLEIIPLVHRQLAHLYGIEEQSIFYENEGLARALKEAFGMNARVLQQKKEGLALKRAQLLNESVFNMKAALEKIGIVFPKERKEKMA